MNEDTKKILPGLAEIINYQKRPTTPGSNQDHFEEVQPLTNIEKKVNYWLGGDTLSSPTSSLTRQRYHFLSSEYTPP